MYYTEYIIIRSSSKEEVEEKGHEPDTKEIGEYLERHNKCMDGRDSPPKPKVDSVDTTVKEPESIRARINMLK